MVSKSKGEIKQPENKNILIAEDDLYLSKAMSSFLAEDGLCIDIANNGIEAIDFISRKQYRLILLDLNMPFKTGFDVLKELQKNADRPPTLVFSNFNMPAAKEKALSLGAREYFVKHMVDIADLRTIVRVYMKGDIK